MKKTVQELALQKGYGVILESFKRANKVRKEKLAIEAGFKDATLYKEFLEKAADVTKKAPAKKVSKSKITKDLVKIMENSPKIKAAKVPPAPAEKIIVHNVHILDASGSMSGGKFNNALAGINKEIELLKNDDTVDYTQTVVSFSSTNQVIRFNFKTPIKNVVPIVDSAKGATALYDTVGIILSELLRTANGKDKYLIKVFTDGGDNDGPLTYRTPGVLSKLIKEAEAKGFTVAFVGTAQDVGIVTRFLQLDESNTLIHDNTSRGVAMSFMASAGATMSYSKKASLGQDVKKGFYKRTGTL